MTSSKRIAKNTAFMYTRMVVVMIINLFAVRVVLKALGTEDYGIYNAVAGIITMLTCVSTVLSNATQRFYSYALGKGDCSSLKNIYTASFIIYLLFAFFVILIGETVGLWFLNYKMVIPETRMVAANWIYQFSIFSFLCTLLQIPYTAAIIARENLGVYAIITTVDSILRLIAALAISIAPLDSLILYAGLLFGVHLLVFFIFLFFAKAKYIECHFQKIEDKIIFKQLLSFSGWSFFGSVAGVGMMQVNTLLVNVFFGPIVNAARAIALQIYAALTSLCTSFVTAVKPPMIKTFAEGDEVYLQRLFVLSNKFIIYFLSLICIPLFFEMPYILDIWLNVSDADTILFSRLMVLYTALLSMHEPITVLMQASNHVKEYHVPVESFTLLCVPLTYLFFKTGNPASSTFYIMIIIMGCAHLIRLECLKKYFHFFSYKSYFCEIILPAVLILLLTGAVVLSLHYLYLTGFFRLLLVIVVSSFCILTAVYFIAISKEERLLLHGLINNFVVKLHQRHE